jgi:hypothetical protein
MIVNYTIQPPSTTQSVRSLGWVRAGLTAAERGREPERSRDGET